MPYFRKPFRAVVFARHRIPAIIFSICGLDWIAWLVMHARSLYAALFREFLQAVVVKVQADFNIFVEFGPSREHTKHG